MCLNREDTVIIRIEFEAVNAEDLKAKLEGWLRGGVTAAPVVDRECDPAPEVASEKKPVGRPRKAVEATVAADPAPKAEPTNEVTRPSDPNSCLPSSLALSAPISPPTMSPTKLIAYP